VVLNEKLLDVLGEDVTQDEAFAHANDVLKERRRRYFGNHQRVRRRERRLRRRANRDGRTRQGHDGTAGGQRPGPRPHRAEQAVACPLLEGIDLSGAKGVLVLVTASKAIAEAERIQAGDEHDPRLRLAGTRMLIYGAAYDDNLGDEMRVTVVATGLSRQDARARRRRWK